MAITEQRDEGGLSGSQSESIFDKSEAAASEFNNKQQLLIRRQSAYNNLALWSHPAWFNFEQNSIHMAAISEWVKHHRVWMAADRVTIAEIVGQVKGVIPTSRLAKYGEYSYNLDNEELYRTSQEPVPVLFNNRTCKNQVKKFDIRLSKAIRRCKSKQERKKVYKLKPDMNIKDTGSSTNMALESWLTRWERLLRNVEECIVNVGQFDDWTETLLKVCFRFFASIRNNPSLLSLMDEDVPFITDFKQLLKDEVTTTELLSIPQPDLENESCPDVKETNNLWLKLSSVKVRNLWDGNGLRSKNLNLVENMQDSSIGITNFLRRNTKCKALNGKEDIELSREEAKDFLGPLVALIDEFPNEKETTSSSDEKSKATAKDLLQINQEDGISCRNGVDRKLFDNLSIDIQQPCSRKVASQPLRLIQANSTIELSTTIPTSSPHIFSTSRPSFCISSPPPNFIVPPPNSPFNRPNLMISPPNLSISRPNFSFPTPNLCSTRPYLPAQPLNFPPPPHLQAHQQRQYPPFANQPPACSFMNRWKRPPQFPMASSANPAYRCYNQTQINFQTASQILNQRQQLSSCLYHQNIMLTMSAQSHMHQMTSTTDKPVWLQDEFVSKEINKSRSFHGANLFPNPVNSPVQCKQMSRYEPPAMHAKEDGRNNLPFFSSQLFHYAVSKSISLKTVSSENIQGLNGSDQEVWQKPKYIMKHRKDLPTVLIQKWTATNGMKQFLFRNEDLQSAHFRRVYAQKIAEKQIPLLQDQTNLKVMNIQLRKVLLHGNSDALNQNLNRNTNLNINQHFEQCYNTGRDLINTNTITKMSKDRQLKQQENKSKLFRFSKVTASGLRKLPRQSRLKTRQKLIKSENKLLRKCKFCSKSVYKNMFKFSSISNFGSVLCRFNSSEKHNSKTSATPVKMFCSSYINANEEFLIKDNDLKKRNLYTKKEKGGEVFLKKGRKIGAPLSAQHLIKIVDDILFQKELNSSDLKAGKFNGWTHFKLVLITILQKAALLLEKKI